jgi:hypothetical protein
MRRCHRAPFSARLLSVLLAFLWIRPSIGAEPGDVAINEIAAVNILGLEDEDGERPDWIELRNGAGSAIDLTGWSLTDDPDEEDKWLFPPLSLPPNGYLVVFASGKIRDGSGGGPIHTNFELRATGEFLGLYDNSSPRKPVSIVTRYPRQREGYTYGYSDTFGEYAYLFPATPGASNASAQSFLPPPAPVTLSPERGFYDAPIEVTLSHEEEGAAIYYTTDGNTPSPATGALYTGPIAIGQTTPLRAAAYLPDRLPSWTTTHTYLIEADEVIRSLPVYSLVTENRNLFGREGILGIGPGYHNPSKRGRIWERPVSFEFLDPSDGTTFQEDAGIRVHGSDFWRAQYSQNSKFAYRLYFRSDYGIDELVYPIFPESNYDRHKKIVLRAGHNDIDNPFIKDEMVRRLFRDMGQVSSVGSFVHILINGELEGYFNPVERLDHDFFAVAHSGGEEWDTIRQGGGVSDGDRVAWNELLSAIEADLSDPEAYAEVTRQLDVVNFIDYLLVNIYVSTGDWPQNNWTAARERRPGARFRFYVWDAEVSFGTSGMGGGFNFNTIQIDLAGGGALEIPRLYQALAVNEDFRRLFATRMATHLTGNGALTESNILRHAGNSMKDLSKAIPFNSGAAALATWTENRRYQILNHMYGAGLLFPVDNNRIETPLFQAPGSPVPLAPSNGPNLNGDGRIDALDLIQFVTQHKETPK